MRILERLRNELKFRLGLTVAVITGACVLAAVQYSNYRLAEAYRETARGQLLTIARSFGGDFASPGLEDPRGLERRLVALTRLHPGLLGASVGRAGQRPGDVPVASTAGRRARPWRRELEPLRTGRPVYTEQTRGDRRYGELVYPLLRGRSSRPMAVIELELELEELDLNLAYQRLIGLGLALGAALLASALVGGVVSRVLLRPLREMWIATHRLARGKAGTRLAWKRSDEVGVLAGAFDQMADRLEESQGRLQALAFEDPLTGVANLRAFQDRLGAELHRATRENYELAVVALDLDRFKTINDAHGHAVGDDALRLLVEAVQAELRPTDVCGRLGGDEFMIALPRADSRLAARVVERLRVRLSLLPLGLTGQRITFSAGVAEFPKDSVEQAGLIRMADTAMYAAKASGRDTFVLRSGGAEPAEADPPPRASS